MAAHMWFTGAASRVMCKLDIPEAGLGRFPVDGPVTAHLSFHLLSCCQSTGAALLFLTLLIPGAPPQPLSCTCRRRPDPSQVYFADKVCGCSHVFLVSLPVPGAEGRVHHMEGVISVCFPYWRQSSLLMAKSWQGAGTAW